MLGLKLIHVSNMGPWLKFVPTGLMDNNPGLDKIMVWRGIGDKPLSEPMLTIFTDAYMRHFGGDKEETVYLNDTIFCLRDIVPQDLFKYLQDNVARNEDLEQLTALGFHDNIDSRLRIMLHTNLSVNSWPPWNNISPWLHDCSICFVMFVCLIHKDDLT